MLIRNIRIGKKDKEGDLFMNEHDKTVKLTEILNNLEIMKMISNAETKEKMQEIFAENGLDMSISEIDAFIQFMNSDDEGEISENELEGVTGGVDAVWIFTTAWGATKKIAKTCWNAGRWFAKNVG